MRVKQGPSLAEVIVDLTQTDCRVSLQHRWARPVAREGNAFIEGSRKSGSRKGNRTVAFPWLSPSPGKEEPEFFLSGSAVFTGHENVRSGLLTLRFLFLNCLHHSEIRLWVSGIRLEAVFLFPYVLHRRSQF